MHLSQDDITTIATTAAASYLKRGEDLNSSLVKAASDYDMNPEQIKRAVEATNQVTYLTMLKTAEDRTFEFPVANYDSIIENSLTPVTEKTASSLNAPRDVFDIFKTEPEAPMEKKAFDLNSVDTSLTGKEDAMSYLVREYWRGEGQLKKMAEEAEEKILSFGAAGKKFTQDPHWLDKLSHVVEDEKDFKSLSRFLGSTDELTKQASESYQVYRDSDLDLARKVYDEFNGIYDLHKKMASTRSSLEKAGELMVKAGKIKVNPASRLAGTAASGAAKGAGRLTGAGVGAAAGLPVAGALLAVKGAKKALGKNSPFEPMDVLGPVGLQSDSGVWNSLHK